MGLVWTATLHRATPDYFNQSFTIGDIYLRKAHSLGARSRSACSSSSG